LPHKTTLASPSRHLAIEEVEEQAEWHKAERHPQVRLVLRVDAVPHGRGYRHEATEAIHEGDEVGKMVGAQETEMAWVGRVEQNFLFVVRCYIVKDCVVAN
jgi:hypothetical protein